MMKRLTAIYELIAYSNYNSFDVVCVPFPFTDKNSRKKRPAVILSSSTYFNQLIGHSVIAMVTSALHAPWPLDTPISDLQQAGLPSPSVVRIKLFTLDHRLVISRLGTLSRFDQMEVQKTLQILFPNDTQS